MKNLIIIIGTILLGILIVNTFVLGDNDSSLQTAAGNIMQSGVGAISQSLKW